MILKVLRVKNGSKPLGELVRLKVLEDTVLSRFAIVDETYDDDGESNTHRHFYRFPYKNRATKGDFIRVYTGIGKDNIEDHGSYKIFIFYMGFDSCIWNNIGDRIELFEVSPVQRMKVEYE